MGGDLLRELLATFSVEAREHLQVINASLLELERTAEGDARDRLLAELFRAAHSLKGAARAVGAEQIERLAHELETQFDMFRSGDLDPGSVKFDGIYRHLDELASHVDEATGKAPSAPEGGAPATPTGNESPEPHPPAADGTAAAPASDPPGPGSPPSPGPKAADESVRVATSKLDLLTARVGEMHVAQAESEQHAVTLGSAVGDLAELDAAWRKALRSTGHDGSPATSLRAAPVTLLEQGGARLHVIAEQVAGLEAAFRNGQRRRGQLTADLQEDVRRIRMLPLATIVEAFPRMVRDLAREQGKEIDFRVEGSETEVDRFVLEQIKDPLTHLLRNSVDHAIEKPEARAAAGKPRRGTITVKARSRGGQLHLEVADDGAGIDPAAVKATAISRGLLSPDAARGLDDREALGLIFRTAFSTSPIITDLSGRGVGLDVVHETVERLQGTVDVDSRVGEGSRFVLALPLAVAAIRCLLVRAGGQTFALPATSVVRIVRLRPSDVGRTAGREAVSLEGQPVVLASLAAVLGIDLPEQAPQTPAGDRICVVIGSGGRRIALEVDGLAGEQDAIVKGLPQPLPRAPGTTGATILGSGQVVIVLSVVEIMRTAADLLNTGRTERNGEAEARPTLLVADDSITTRTMEKNILEAAGYRVRVAADGAEAWRLLQEADVNLVVSDVTMPGLDGFQLTERVRADKRLRDMPVVLVTSLASDDDRQRGIDAGADAYIVKSAFDQDRLLETIRRLV